MIGAKQKKITTILCLCSLTVIFPTPSLKAETLAGAISKAMSTYPEISAQNYGAAAARERINQAYAGYLPTMDARLATGHEISTNPSTLARVDGDEDLNRSETQLTIRQNIFSGYQTSSSVESYRYGAKSAAMAVLGSAEKLALRVTQVYLDILRSEKLVRLAQKNLETHQALLSLVQDRVRQKVISAADVNQAGARMREAEAAKIRAQGYLTDAHFVYKNVVGEAPADMMAAPDAYETVVSHGVDPLIKVALQKNPAISQARHRVSQAMAEIKRRQAAYYPNLDLNLSASHDRNISGTPGDNDAVSAMLVVNYNLFAGGADKGRVRESILLAKQTKSDLARTSQDVAQNIKITFNAWDISHQRRLSFAKQVKENEAVREAFFEQYKVGRRTLLDLLDAERELFTARSNFTSEHFQEEYAIYQILSNQGQLLAKLGVELPEGCKVGNETFSDALHSLTASE